MRIRSNRFLVTGGAGFIGTYVVRQLVDAGAAEVRVFDRRPMDSKSSSVRSIVGDLGHVEEIRRAADGCDGLLHMAVLPLGPCEQDPVACFEVNVAGTFNVFLAARDAGVKRVVFSSASSVYGDTFETTDEHHPFGSRTMYGASKISGEYFLRAFGAQNAYETIILRYMNVYGPGQTGGLIPATIGRLLRGERPVIIGDGLQSFDFVYVDDVARANILAMASEASDQAFNIGGDVEITVRDVVETLIRLTGSGVEPEYRVDERSPMTRRVGTSVKARQVLGFSPRVPFDEGLRRVVAAARR